MRATGDDRVTARRGTGRGISGKKGKGAKVAKEKGTRRDMRQTG